MTTKTKKSSGSVLSSYMNEISKFPVLTREQEISLSKKIKAGDNVARERFICCNLKLVISIAKNYAGHNVDLSDLIQFGNMGLLQAVERFDHTKGYKFSTYATWWIRQSVRRGLGKTASLIYKPSDVARRQHKINRVFDSMRDRDNIVPDREKLELELDKTDLRILDENYKNVIYFEDMKSDGDASNFLSSNIEDKDNDVQAQANVMILLEALHDALCSLPEKQKYIIEAYNGIKLSKAINGDIAVEYSPPLTLEMISQNGFVGMLSKERIRQIKVIAIQNIFVWFMRKKPHMLKHINQLKNNWPRMDA